MNDIVMIGFGAIGQYVARAMGQEVGHRLSAVICRTGREGQVSAIAGPTVQVASHIDSLESRPACVLDCAGHSGLIEHGVTVLERGWDLATVSVGALADEALYSTLVGAAESSGARLHIVSGAIGALDALSSAREGGLVSVLYRGAKPPAGWIGSPAASALDLGRLSEATTHFSGTARQAALQYPKNANVAAAVALAGVGFENTRVELVADPALTRNVHTIEAKGAFGSFSFEIAGKALPDAPRSSALTAMSVVRHVRNIGAAVSL